MIRGMLNWCRVPRASGNYQFPQHNISHPCFIVECAYARSRKKNPFMETPSFPVFRSRVARTLWQGNSSAVTFKLSFDYETTTNHFTQKCRSGLQIWDHAMLQRTKGVQRAMGGAYAGIMGLADTGWEWLHWWKKHKRSHWYDRLATNYQAKLAQVAFHRSCIASRWDTPSMDPSDICF